MKITLIVILNIIFVISVSSKNLKPPDILKGGNSEKNFNLKNKSKSIKSSNDLKNKKDLGKLYYSKDRRFFGDVSMKKTTTDIEKDIFDFFGPNRESLNLKKKNLFIACCLKGGLTSNKQILSAYEWALKNKYIEKDYKINISKKELAKNISKQFNSTYHSEWKIEGSSKNEKYFFKDSKTYKIISPSAVLSNGDYNFKFSI